MSLFVIFYKFSAKFSIIHTCENYCKFYAKVICYKYSNKLYIKVKIYHIERMNYSCQLKKA